MKRRPYKPEIKVDNKPLVSTEEAILRHYGVKNKPLCQMERVTFYPESSPLEMLYKMGMVTDLQK